MAILGRFRPGDRLRADLGGAQSVISRPPGAGRRVLADWPGSWWRRVALRRLDGKQNRHRGSSRGFPVP